MSRQGHAESKRPKVLPREDFQLLRRLWRGTHGRDLPLRISPSEDEAARIALSLLRSRLRPTELARDWLRRGGKDFASAPDGSTLGPRLRETLWLLLDGQSEEQMAEVMALTPQTVNSYIRQIYRHFAVSTRAELMALWFWPGFRREPGRPRPLASA